MQQKRWTLMRGVARTRRAWEEHMKQLSASVGIPDSYRQVLMYLRHHPGASQRSMADFLNITPSAINQTVKAMADDGYVRKETDPADKRSFRLFLSEQGEETAGELRGRLELSDRAITEFVGEEREQELTELLHQLTDFIKKELIE